MVSLHSDKTGNKNYFSAAFVKKDNYSSNWSSKKSKVHYFSTVSLMKRKSNYFSTVPLRKRKSNYFSPSLQLFLIKICLGNGFQLLVEIQCAPLLPLQLFWNAQENLSICQDKLSSGLALTSCNLFRTKTSRASTALLRSLDASEELAFMDSPGSFLLSRWI